MGFIGLGRMGRPMAANLEAAGFPVLRFDPFVPVSARTEPAQGWTDDLTRIARTSVSVSVLPDGKVTDSVLRSPDFLRDVAPGHVHISMATIGAEQARSLSAELAERAVVFVDAPVSGSATLVAAAQISCMVGCEPDVFEGIRPLLAAMTRDQLHLGPVGAGAAMKLAIQALIGITNQGVAEALVLAEASGISRDLALDAIAVSAVATPYASYKRSVYTSPHPAREPVAAPISLLQKDLRLTLADAGSLHAPMPLTRAASALLDEAAAAGLAAADVGAVIERLGQP